MNEFRVWHLEDNIYQVVCFDMCNNDIISQDQYESATTVFQGSLADCEAYIRLNESGYMA